MPTSLHNAARKAGYGWFTDELVAAAASGVEADEGPTLVERRARAGAMSPLHRRDEREVYCVVSGSVTFYVGDEVIGAGPGDVVVAPPGAERTVRADSDEARWLILTRVARRDLFEDFGRAFAAPAPGRTLSPEEHLALCVVGAANGIELLGPPGALPGGH